MSEAGESCLVSKLGHFTELSNGDREMLARFEADSQDYRKRDRVRRAGESIEQLYVVKSGWFFGFTLLPSGKRQVHRIYFPGDFIGTHEIVCAAATYDIAAASDGTLCPFRKEGLGFIFERSPRLTALIYSMEALEQITQDDRLRSIARMDASGRIAHLFLQIFGRLRITNPGLGLTIRMELSQELIGDALGLTGIHVNRTLRSMSEEGLIRFDGSELTLLDEQRLAELADFDDRHYRIDTSWFPQLKTE